MPYYVKMDLYQVVEYHNGAISKTKKIRSEWFRSDDAPEPYVIDAQGFMFANTTDTHFGPDKPTE